METSLPGSMLMYQMVYTLEPGKSNQSLRDQSHTGLSYSFEIFKLLLSHWHSRGHMFCRVRIRKRRRQNYFVKTALKERKKRKIKTKDDGKFDLPPPRARRGIFISEKLKVVRRYNELVKQKQEATQISHRKVPSGMTSKQKKEFANEKEKAREILKVNILKKCKEEFPEIAGNCQVWKWAAQAEREKWEDLPERDKKKRLEVPSGWRKKMNLPHKELFLLRSSTSWTRSWQHTWWENLR